MRVCPETRRWRRLGWELRFSDDLASAGVRWCMIFGYLYVPLFYALVLELCLSALGRSVDAKGGCADMAS